MKETVKMKKLNADLLFYFIMMILGIFVFIYSYNYPALNPLGAHGIGPRLFPQLAGGAMALISAYSIILEKIIKKKVELLDDIPDDAYLVTSIPGTLTNIIFIAVMVGYVMFLLPTFKFIAATFVSIAILLYILKVRSIWLVAAPALMTAFYWLLFVRVLRVPFP